MDGKKFFLFLFAIMLPLSIFISAIAALLYGFWLLIHQQWISGIVAFLSYRVLLEIALAIQKGIKAGFDL